MQSLAAIKHSKTPTIRGEGATPTGMYYHSFS